MTISEKLQIIAENEEKVYDAGYISGFNSAPKIGKRFTTGTVIFTTTQAQQTITHNLGVNPTIFLMYAKINKEDVNYGVEGEIGNQGWFYAYRYFNCKPYYPLLDFDYTAANSSDGGTITQTLIAKTYAGRQHFCFADARLAINVTDTTIKTGYGASYIYYPLNVEFEWIAIE